MVVNPSVPASTIPEFIAYAAAKPDKINVASAGNGTPSHVAAVLFRMSTSLDLFVVPYRGGGAARHVVGICAAQSPVTLKLSDQAARSIG